MAAASIPGYSSEPNAYQRALKLITARLIPFLFLLYIVAYLDRVNVSFAQLQMKDDLKFSDAIYGLGAGIFFVGYALFEFPSNLILAKVGARKWICRIMVVWGLLAAAMAFVKTPQQFYVMRFLLGLGEAGFFPGMIYYLTCWFPVAERARAIALFMTATVISGVVGSPVSGLILDRFHNVGGMDGWQWLFILEGLPACVLGIVVLFYMTDSPEKADWLPEPERKALIETLRREQAHRESKGHHPSLKALLDPKVAQLTAVYFFCVSGSYGISMWMPQIIKGFGKMSDTQVGLLQAIPYALAAVAMVLNGRHSDKTRERKLHVIIPTLCCALGLTLSGIFKQPVFAFASLCLAQMGISSYLGPYWALPTSFLAGTAAAGGIALINSVGNLGGFAGPYLVGYIKEKTHSFSAPLFVLAGFVVVGAILVALLKHDHTLEMIEHPDEEEVLREAQMGPEPAPAT